MKNGPVLKTTWYEKAAYAVCPPIAWKIREIREEIAKRRLWKKLDKLILAQKDYCCKLTPEEFVKSAQMMLAGC